MRYMLIISRVLSSPSLTRQDIAIIAEARSTTLISGSIKMEFTELGTVGRFRILF
jgi:hypothetical protein